MREDGPDQPFFPHSVTWPSPRALVSILPVPLTNFPEAFDAYSQRESRRVSHQQQQCVWFLKLQQGGRQLVTISANESCSLQLSSLLHEVGSFLHRPYNIPALGPQRCG